MYRYVTNEIGNTVSKDRDKYFSDVVKAHEEALAKYKGTEYEKYLSSNPFVGMQASGGLFGIGKRQQQYEIAQNAAKYDADQLNKIADLEYNLPKNQASRENAAGYNVDLQGLQGAGQAQASESASKYGNSMIDPGEQGVNIVNSLLNIASLGMSFPQELLGLVESQLAVHGFQIENAAAVDEMAKARVADMPIINPSPEDEQEYPNLIAVARSFGDRAETIAKYLFPSKRLQKQFVSAYNSHYNTLASQAQRYSNSADLIRAMQDPYIIQPEGMKDITRLAIQYQIKKAELDVKYADLKGTFLDENGNLIRSAMKAEQQEMISSASQAGSQASIAASEARAAAAESSLRVEKANATDASALGEQESAEARARKAADEYKELQYNTLREAEDTFDRIDGFGKGFKFLSRSIRYRRAQKRLYGNRSSLGDAASTVLKFVK